MLVAGQGMAVAFVGVAIGAAAAFGLTRFMRTLLLGTDATDLLTFASGRHAADGRCRDRQRSSARRAARVDFVVVLKME
jgi:putative ABC transport system permease protein